MTIEDQDKPMRKPNFLLLSVQEDGTEKIVGHAYWYEPPPGGLEMYVDDIKYLAGKLRLVKFPGKESA